MLNELFACYQATVLPEWIDYNGHLNLAYYVLAFDKATDFLLDHLGLGQAYRRSTNFSMYALEAHVTYEQELKEGDPIAVTTQLIAADRRRVQFFHRMHRGAGGPLAATIELMALHVDLSGPRAAPIPDDAFARIETLLEAHRQLPKPPQLGRGISMGQRRASS